VKNLPGNPELPGRGRATAFLLDEKRRKADLFLLHKVNVKRGIEDLTGMIGLAIIPFLVCQQRWMGWRQQRQAPSKPTKSDVKKGVSNLTKAAGWGKVHACA
jgi:hypothetical protein